MALVSNAKSSLYGGVNQQSAEHRLETQVEECINAYPTVNQGLLKRNPTEKLNLTDTINFSEYNYIYSYDRGLAGNSEEKYAIIINNGGMEIINVISGKVYNKVNGGLIYTGNAESYLFPFANANSYSAVTIKDTTFIVNKSKYVMLDPFVTASATNAQTVTRTIYYNVDNFNYIFSKSYTFKVYNFVTEETNASYYYKTIKQTDIFPTKIYSKFIKGDWYYLYYVSYFDIWTTRSKLTINIDGIVIDYEIPAAKIGSYVVADFRADGVGEFVFNPQLTYDEWFTNVLDKINNTLDKTKYRVSPYQSYKDIMIERIDGQPITVTTTLTIDPVPTDAKLLIIDGVSTDYYVGNTTGSYVDTFTIPAVDYTKTCFFWIKSSNPTAAYSYTYQIDDGVNTISGTVSNTTTEAVATDLAADINVKALGYTAIASGSFVKVTSANGSIVSLSISDTYGNQASFAWGTEVNSMYDLPKTLPFYSIVKVINTDINEDSGYWLEFEGGIWRECLGFDVQPKLDYSTMPHILVRNSNDTFTFSQWDKWADMQVGDKESNKAPSFVNNYIKDIFFFKNRLGFITSTSCIMSEVGNYGNFFRTSVVALLDSDRIDTSVDTTKAISLEFATYLEDSLMLFSDKAQFKLEGGNILSPSNVQISQTSAYEINKNVRPIFINNKLFFCAKRGEHTAVMQYFVDGNGRVSEAVDITSHVEKYIPQDVSNMSASAINNMLFLYAPSDPSTIYVYKYLDDGDKRVQSAWFKWEYDGTIYSMFSLGKNLNIMIERTDIDDATIKYNQFEIQQIQPKDYLSTYYVDSSNIVDVPNTISKLIKTTTSSVLSITCNIPLNDDVKISEILPSTVGNRSWTVTLSDGSFVTGSQDTITVLRKVSINIIKIDLDLTLQADGYEFNGLYAEYVQNIDNSNLLYNGDFTYDYDNWIFSGWTVISKTKDKGYVVKSNIDIGEWVLRSGNNTFTEGILQFKSIQISSEKGSDFYINVKDIYRNTDRKILAKYTVDRKPMVYGNAKHIRLKIVSDTSKGFRINSIVFEGNFNSKNRRI